MAKFVLPDDYSLIKKVNLKEDKKLSLLINMYAFIFMIVLFLFGSILCPYRYIIRVMDVSLFLIVMPLQLITYAFLHELVHGFFIKKYSGKRATYGLSLVYAYAGSTAYFNKRQYTIIAIAPVLFFGILFLLLNILLPLEWFWIFYFVQIFNLSGAAGDIYILYTINKLPVDILVKDTGLIMEMYSRNIKH